ncbi:helix-turn-helix domain-containing protein [Sphingobacterium multivorum]|uniref:helix-turn-helix domain-containing protein n=1 Tax=Sphingobacterium multivorum TaxID=28454 RepID=UPI0031BA0794
MIREYNDNVTAARFVMHSDNNQFSGRGLRSAGSLPINTFIYNKGGEQKVTIDEISYTMPSRCILPLVSNQHFVFEQPDALTAWQFNREFYCIVDHDAEVGCVGFLFYGIRHPMFIVLNDTAVEEMSHLENVFSNEMMVKDNFQGEMLRTLLKRVIINTTREEHEVRFYAAALNKSPKTLSNVFGLLKQSAPSVLIRNRIILEAKRYLHYTEKSAKEIAYELGFESPAHFSRFFKKYSGTNVSAFKNL